MSIRYFQAQNCNRWPQLFTPSDTIGGILWGSCEVEDAGKIAQIEALAKQPKLGVTEMTPDDYAKSYGQKKTNSIGSTHFSPRPVQSSASPVSLVDENKPGPSPQIPAPQPQAPNSSAMKGPGAQVEPEGLTQSVEPAIEAGKPVPSIAEALQTGPIEPPPSAKPRNSAKIPRAK